MPKGSKVGEIGTRSIVFFSQKYIFVMGETKNIYFRTPIPNEIAQMAESVDALVSNTNEVTLVPVRLRLWVQKSVWVWERERGHKHWFFFDPHSVSVSRLINYRDFRFSKLKVYTKAKVFHLDCKRFIVNARPDSYVKDQLGRASFCIALNSAEGSGKFPKADRRNISPSLEDPYLNG